MADFGQMSPDAFEAFGGLSGDAFAFPTDPFAGFETSSGFNTDSSFFPPPDPFSFTDPFAGFEASAGATTATPGFSPSAAPPSSLDALFGLARGSTLNRINPPFTLASPLVGAESGFQPFTGFNEAPTGFPGFSPSFFPLGPFGPSDTTLPGSTAFTDYETPEASQLFSAGEPLTVPLTPTDPEAFLRQGAEGGPPGAPQPGGLGGIWNRITNMDARQVALVLGLGSGAIGVIGLIQKMLQGDKAARATLTRKYNEGTPEERAAITTALQGMQQMAQSPTGGINPLDPNVASLVEQAFQPQLGSIASQQIESARRRGFHDQPLTAPTSGIYGQALSDIQGQMAQAKLALAQAIASQKMGGYQNMGSLLSALQGSRGFTQTTQGPKPTLADLYGPLAGIMGNVAQGLGAYGATAPKR